jgi:hypothetical protein
VTKSAKLFRLKVHTGPTIATWFADVVRSVGGIDVITGTETVFFTWSGDDDWEAVTRFIKALETIHGPVTGINCATVIPYRCIG